jgi:hypothetical protein
MGADLTWTDLTIYLTGVRKMTTSIYMSCGYNIDIQTESNIRYIPFISLYPKN